MDIAKAMKNPASTLGTPETLSESSELTAEQKRAVLLLQWKDQLEQLHTADDEGMQKSEPAAGATGDLTLHSSAAFPISPLPKTQGRGL
jgi:hypothetical protein